ncbi:MAG: MBL fold metallo-hydrolase RNA specificity domain-containing protein, partial [Patescibacteria group bacterium]
NSLRETGAIPEVPVFLDSPMAIHATEIFENHTDLWSKQARTEFTADDFFAFPGLRMTATREESRTINGVPPPKVIIAGSGMMHGGRILHHAKRYLSDPNSTLLIIGYQAGGTLGRTLLSGAKHVRIHGEQIFVRAQIKAIGAFSAHADQPRLLAWLKAIDHAPKQIALVHGELDQMRALSHLISQDLHAPVALPKIGESVEVR